MKNIDVIEAFIEKKCANCSNLYYDGSKLINYNTTLAQWHDNYHLIINCTRYSVTTSKNQNYLKTAITDDKGIVIKEVNHIPKNTRNLESYADWYTI